MKLNSIFFLIALLFIGTASFGQKSKSQLQKEKTENLRQIKEAQATLQKTAAQKKASLGQLNAYQFQITAQENLITTYKNEIKLLVSEIEQDQQIIDALEQDVKNLKSEYGAMVYAAYKASRGQDQLTFLFSAHSFNQLFRRLHYLRQYTEARKKQVNQINAVQEMLASQITSIEEKKANQSSLLASQLNEKDKLLTLKDKQQKVVAELASREGELQAELIKRNKALATLNKLIDDIIKKEIAAAAAAKSRALKKSEESSEALSLDFSKNKAHLQWPVKGFISQPFGISKDPILKGVERNNSGIDIQTTPNSTVKCVSAGKVSSVNIIQGFNKAVIINHGEYFSVYAKLGSVNVKKGQTIAAGATIGNVYTDSDGIAELHFEIWKSFTKLNPQLWLIKK